MTMSRKDILEELSTATQKFFDKPCFIMSPSDVMSYSRFVGMADLFCDALRREGISAGQTVAVHTRSPLVASLLYWSFLKIGVTWLEYSPLLAQEEWLDVDAVVSSASLEPNIDAKFIKIDGAWIQNAATSTGTVRTNFELNGSRVGSIWSYSVSSGTTGRPKYMPVSYELAYKRMMIAKISEDAKSHLCLYSVTKHNYAQPWLSSFMNGVATVARSDMATITAVRPSIISGAPSHASNLLRNLSNFDRTFPLLALGGAKASMQFIATALRKFDSVRVSYGSNEAWGVLSEFYSIVDDSIERTSTFQTKGSEIQLRDEERLIVEPNVEGEVYIRSATMIDGYAGFNKMDWLEHSSDGWFRPGDVGHWREDGSLHIVGRVGDVFNFYGVKIHAEVLDERAEQLNEVSKCVSFPVLDNFNHDRLGLVIFTESTDLTDLAEQVRIKLGELKQAAFIPYKIFFNVELPMTDTGKYIRRSCASTCENSQPY